MLRKIAPSDRTLLEKWIESDPHHAGVLTADSFYPLSLAVEDERGYVAMFILMAPHPPDMRLFIQFCPDPHKVAKALLRGFPEFIEMVKPTGAEALLFDTKNEKLAAFCQRAWGFEPLGNSDYRLLLERP